MSSIIGDMIVKQESERVKLIREFFHIEKKNREEINLKTDLDDEEIAIITEIEFINAISLSEFGVKLNLPIMTDLYKSLKVSYKRGGRKELFEVLREAEKKEQEETIRKKVMGF